MMWRRYGEYLVGLKDEAYRDTVFAYVTREDTPRPLMYQLDLLRKVGFRQIEVLHKTSVFAAFGAWTYADRIAAVPAGEVDDSERSA
jgi:tRNA (cmo5U34)-methyltransferase